MPIPTNILSLPLAHLTIETGNNEDWVDSVKYVISDVSPPPVDAPQLDLRGINFAMEIRRSAEDHEVVLDGSTLDGRLIIGISPDFGFLTWAIDNSVMRLIHSGGYVGDIVASDAIHTRVCIQFDLTIIEGVTR